jgi:hypothetical protein
MRDQFIKNLWLWKCGKPEKDIKKKKLNIKDLVKSEWSKEFEILQRNRLLIGAFRYGTFARQDYSKYNLTQEIKNRVERYENDKNLEHLVDAANICQLAFIHGQRLGHKLVAIDDGEHTPEI